MYRIAAFLLAASAVLFSATTGASENAEARANQVPLRLVDANQKVLGRLLYAGDLQQSNAVWFVVMREGKQVFTVPFGPTGVERTKVAFYSGPVFFANSDCSGAAYLTPQYAPLGGPFLLGAAVNTRDGRTVLYISADAREQQVRTQSSQQGTECFATDSETQAVPVASTIDITGKYQPPFTVR